MTDFKVYDRVWMMYNNRPTQVIVYSIFEEMNHAKNGTEKSYSVVPDICGASESTSIRIGYRQYLFKTKEELLASL